MSTPLLYAVQYDHYEVARVLLDKGAMPNFNYTLRPKYKVSS